MLVKNKNKKKKLPLAIPRLIYPSKKTYLSISSFFPFPFNTSVSSLVITISPICPKSDGLTSSSFTIFASSPNTIPPVAMAYHEGWLFCYLQIQVLSQQLLEGQYEV